MLNQETQATSDLDQPVASAPTVRGPRSFRQAAAETCVGRVADLLVASGLLLLTLPLAALVCLAIKLDSPGPIFSRQLLLGRDGRSLQVLRFRTTPHDPEPSASALIWYGNAPTTVGRLLRYTRLDELPRLLNVLRGDLRLLDWFLL